MSEKIKVKRSQFATFLNTGGTTAVWSRFGKGVTSQSVAYNPTVNSEQYIDEDNATSSVDAYAPTINTPQTAYKGDPVFEYIDELRQSRAIGDDAVTDMLLVYMYNKDDKGAYMAEKQKVSISITDFGGDAGSPLSITYDLGFIGDPVIGTVTVTDGTASFTEKNV
ncbi:MAG: hypothetical protein HFE82_07540 [Erysipelotrichaceae bacterium]|nr:hypothetical protein [Erysipelotrichaceae bacterium]